MYSLAGIRHRDLYLLFPPLHTPPGHYSVTPSCLYFYVLGFHWNTTIGQGHLLAPLDSLHITRPPDFLLLLRGVVSAVYRSRRRCSLRRQGAGTHQLVDHVYRDGEDDGAVVFC